MSYSIHDLTIPTHMHISSLEELESCIGQVLWTVGYGGLMKTIEEPRKTSILIGRENGNGLMLVFLQQSNRSIHLGDWNVYCNSQNSWYLCKSKAQAQEVYDLLSTYLLMLPEKASPSSG